MHERSVPQAQCYLPFSLLPSTLLSPLSIEYFLFREFDTAEVSLVWTLGLLALVLSSPHSTCQ